MGFATLSVVVLPAQDASAATAVVTNCNDSGPGSLRQAVASANPGDTITFALSPACSTVTLVSGQIEMSQSVTISGPGADVLAVSGDNASRVFQVDTGATVTISGLTIENGQEAWQGAGGILNNGALTIDNSALSDNVSGTGGGGVANAGTLTINDSTLSENSALGIGSGDMGSGGAIGNSGDLSVSNSTLSGNRGLAGGGITNFGGNVSITNSTLSGNVATDGGSHSGGGIINFDTAEGYGTVSLTATIMANNASGGDCAGVEDGGYNIDDDGTCGFKGTSISDSSILDATLGSLANNGGSTQTIALEPDSPAIGAVNNAPLCSTPDQRGVVRPTPCDIGAYQTTVDTVTNCNDSGPGSLPDVVRSAPSAAIINFAVQCPASSPITLTSTIDINTNLTIAGPGASTLAVSGNNAVEVFDVSPDVNVTISGLTIENGLSVNGGGIENDGTLNVTDSTLTGNRATGNYPGGGGGIINHGTLNIGGSTVSDNSAPGGYAAGVFNSGTVTMIDSTVSDNSAQDGGGGIFNDHGGSLTVSDSTMSNNSANEGGGIWSYGNTLSVSASTVSDNTASAVGGGIANIDGVGTITNTTLSSNSAPGGFGGGIYNGGTLTVTNSTLWGNGGAVNGGIWNGLGTVSLAATIVANSSGSDCTDYEGAITDAGYNLDDDGSCGFSGSSLSDKPAGLDPAGLQNLGGPTQTIVLESGSVAVGAVNSASLCSTPDQRGVARPTPCDIGAYQTTSLATPSAPTITNIPGSGVAIFGGSFLPIVSTTGDGTTSVTSSTPAVCTLSSGTVDYVGVGACTLTAHVAPGSDYAGADGSPQSFNVGPASQSVSFTSTPPSNAVVGSPTYTVSATGGASGKPVTYSIDASSEFVCGISGSVVTFIGAGTCTIDANQAGNLDYAPAPQAQQSFSVAPASRCVFTNHARATADAGQAFSFVVLTNVCSPWPTITGTGLPSWLTLTDYHDGYTTLTATDPLHGRYHFTLTATNSAGTVKQKFVLKVSQH